MKNITLTNETFETLRNLINEIDYEESRDNDVNIDTVVEDTYKVLDIVRNMFKEVNEDTRKVIDCPTVILKLHLYDIDEDGNYIPMDGESLEESINDIRSKDDVSGFTITDFEVTTEELDVTDWD